jgi:hypothetical protein
MDRAGAVAGDRCRCDAVRPLAERKPSDPPAWGERAIEHRADYLRLNILFLPMQHTLAGVRLTRPARVQVKKPLQLRQKPGEQSCTLPHTSPFPAR